MTAKTTLSDLDIAAKFLLGLFAFLALAACVAVLGGCSSAAGPAPLCKAGSHAVYLKSEHATACAVDGTADPCGNGTDCTSGCCDAVNGDLTIRRCVDDVSADPNGFCVCAGGGDSACPVGTTCQSLPAADECVVSEAAPDAGSDAVDAGCTTTLECHSAIVDPDSGACLVVPNSYTCQGGLCYAGACCTGCFDGVTCQPGHAPDACGQGGTNCRVNPMCP
jgi:hypothetical protein